MEEKLIFTEQEKEAAEALTSELREKLKGTVQDDDILRLRRSLSTVENSCVTRLG